MVKVVLVLVDEFVEEMNELNVPTVVLRHRPWSEQSMRHDRKISRSSSVDNVEHSMQESMLFERDYYRRSLQSLSHFSPLQV